ncbi:hypothetical protein SUNI508_10536 [Seiridium unicorne]|uniref:Uncharacterized protein n=1 Tax=Seiridium unicorne TaxID=138068 RepID=A0ABR2UM18_9PEZI
MANSTAFSAAVTGLFLGDADLTAANFLGYHFNTASLWYLYYAEKDTISMILEVHNTFGDRRMYLLEANDPVTKAVGDSDVNSKGDEAKQTAKKSNGTMRRAWPKDFHVSSFNSRKGKYSLVVNHPFAPMLEGRGTLVNTICLVSPRSHAELVACIFSNGDAIDPGGLSFWHELKFLASWWWVGFVTFPRIVKPAGTLFFKRQLHVWYRPEPLRESLGRRANETERQLELVFRK